MLFLPIVSANRINVIFEWYLLGIIIFLVRRRDAENIGKKKKTDRKKKSKIRRKKNEEYREVK